MEQPSKQPRWPELGPADSLQDQQINPLDAEDQELLQKPQVEKMFGNTGPKAALKELNHLYS